VSIGKVCVVNYGEMAGKLCTIVDVVDQNRVLVEGSTTGVARQTIPFKCLSVTPLSVKVGRNARASTVAKAFAKENTLDAWSKTAWAKKAAIAAKRNGLNDFQRFQVMVLRKQRSQIIGRKVAALKKGGKK
jgi:large subunit ribosomal protein L14e